MTDEPEQARARLRAFVRDNHPDRGGDPEVFAAGLAKLRAEETSADVRPRVTVTPAVGPLERLSQLLHRRRRPPRVK